jgi:hypothetical protein
MFTPMMRRAPLNTLQRRRILACSLLLAVCVCASLPGVSQASRKIRGPGYSTVLPNGWKVAKSRAGAWYYLRAFAPQKGQAGTSQLLTVGISVISTKGLAKQARVKRLPSSPQDLLPLVANSLNGAQNVQVVAPIRSTALRAAPAAASAVTYALGNTSVLQSNVVSPHGRRVFSVELEVDQSIQYAGTKVLSSLLKHWRWH